MLYQAQKSRNIMNGKHTIKEAKIKNGSIQKEGKLYGMTNIPK